MIPPAAQRYRRSFFKNWISAVFLLVLITGCNTNSQLLDEPSIAGDESVKPIIPTYIESAFIKEYATNGVNADTGQRLEAVADLDADDKPDYVITVRSEGGTRLLMVHLSDNDLVQLISKNSEIEYPTPQKIEVISSGPGGGYLKQGLKGDGLLITKLESSSALLYWNGVEFFSIWQGD